MSSLKEVAKRAGVSPITVSRVVNSPEIVSPKTIAVVRSAMEELDYSINPIAKALVTKKTHVIDVYIPSHIDVNNQYVMQLISGISEVLSQSMYSFLLIRDLKIDHICDGYVVTGLYEGELDTLIDYVTFNDRKFVLFGKTDREEIDYIDVDNVAGAKEIVNYLIDNGHQEIAMLNVEDEKKYLYGKERYLGYADALREANLPIDEHKVFRADNNVGSAYSAACEFLKDLSCSALFCVTDTMAVGVMQACREMNIRVPEDLSIVGYDGYGYQVMVQPNITTMVQPIFDIGKLLAKTLINRLKNDSKEHVNQLIRPSILIGESVKKM